LPVSEGSVFGFDEIRDELLRSSEEILWDLKEDIDPWAIKPKNSQENLVKEGLNQLFKQKDFKKPPFTPNNNNQIDWKKGG